MIKGDYVSLARVGMFDSDAWGIILNDKCTAGYVVVGYDSDDMQFRVKVRCELVDVIPAPKFKVGDIVWGRLHYPIYMNQPDKAVMEIKTFYMTKNQGWWYDANGAVYGLSAGEDQFKLVTI